MTNEKNRDMICLNLYRYPYFLLVGEKLTQATKILENTLRPNPWQSYWYKGLPLKTVNLNICKCVFHLKEHSDFKWKFRDFNLTIIFILWFVIIQVLTTCCNTLFVDSFAQGSLVNSCSVIGPGFDTSGNKHLWGFQHIFMYTEHNNLQQTTFSASHRYLL